MVKKITVAGIGPGSYESMTLEVLSALKECDVIVGYNLYIELLKPHFSNKEFLQNGMMSEEERCKLAVRMAEEGKKVVLVCSGDAGVYGLAGLVTEYAQKCPELEVQVLPGITAALSGAALLGAPLINDFAVVSLSDRLTPWNKIEERLRASAKGDFSIVIYNPESKSRYGYLKKACESIADIIPEKRACGYVKNIGRPGQAAFVCTFYELQEIHADMFTTVFIGNTMTYIKDGKLITMRGYKSEVKDE